jgi:hypothetical protein
VLFACGLASEVALAVVAATQRWSEPALFGAMAALIGILAVITVLTVIRQEGPEIFADRNRSSSRAGS